MKKILIICSILIVCCIVVLALLGAAAKNKNKPEPIPAGKTAVQTRQGNLPLQVNDFTQKAVQKTNDVAVINTSASYKLVYFFKDQSFLITLLSPPLGQARNLAENDLLKQLGISQQQACQLNVSVRVPGDVDGAYSGKELGLSFCAGSTQLP